MTRRKRGAKLVDEHLRALNRGKANYRKADELLERLLTMVEPGDEISLGDGRVARLVDQFAGGRLVVWHSSGCKRYKVEVEERA